MAKIPVIITNFNLYTWPKAMVKKLMRMPGVGPILIVDNDSTYGPTLCSMAGPNPAAVV